MDILTSVSVDSLFSTANDQSARLESLSSQALGSGIDKYMKKDYKGAAEEFKRALGLSPYSQYAVDATKYLAQSYLQMEKPDKAITAYKNMLQLQPNRDDLHTALANLYLAENRVGEAVRSYEAAVRIYDDVNNRFSLGQGYLRAKRYDDAEAQFKKVIQSAPNSSNGYYGLGQTYGAQKKFTEAIDLLERAIQKKRDFYDAYAEMGYVYADAGQIDKAKEIRTDLEKRDPDLAQTLSDYITSKTKPKLMFAWGNSPFQYYLPPRTAVATFSGYLANANTSVSVSMVFQFDKIMDRESVENPTNWTIARSRGNGPGTDYNFGRPIASTEVRLSPYPTDVYYDEKNLTATVRFTITQNATADGTIDPSHIVFTFKGEDAAGNRMDPKYDQFMGFKGSF